MYEMLLLELIKGATVLWAVWLMRDLIHTTAELSALGELTASPRQSY